MSRHYLAIVLAAGLATTLAGQTRVSMPGTQQTAFPDVARIPGPAECLQAVLDFTNSRAQEAASAPPSAALTRQNAQDATNFAKACAAKFPLADAKDTDLVPLASLYAQAGAIDQAKAAIDRALPLKTLSAPSRAVLLAAAIPVVRRSAPPTEARPWRVANLYPKVEALVDELDANPAATFDQKWNVHTSMESAYRSDDIDAGIIKHGNWILTAAKSFSPADRVKYGLNVVFAHVNMAEAYAGQGMNDKALQLLHAAKENWGDIPRAVDSYIAPPLARYELVGTPGAAVIAPVWLNAPAGTRELAMAGTVTLLEFTAHWCGPCRESYPGINRLRERF